MEGYKALADWPSCNEWRELYRLYPNAKFILTVRDPEKWFKSASETIMDPGQSFWIMRLIMPNVHRFFVSMNRKWEPNTRKLLFPEIGADKEYVCV